MHRTRRPPCARVCAAASAAVAVLGLSAPFAAGQTAPDAQRVEDIRISEANGGVSILVLLSAQPTAASAHAQADVLVLEIDGVPLAPFSVTPASAVLVRRIDAQPSGDGGAQFLLSGVALEQVETTIYRNAVLLTGHLAAPPAETTTSLLVAPVTPEHAIEVAALSLEPPIQQTPAQPATISAFRAADIAGVSADRCAQTPGLLQTNAWDMDALGDHALCLLREGKQQEAADRLGQLAAFQPEDARVALGQAEMAITEGKLALAGETLAQALVAADNLDDRRVLGEAQKLLAAATVHPLETSDSDAGVNVTG